MIEYKEVSEALNIYPRLVYYVDDNPDYQKEWKLSDIPDCSVDYYELSMCDCMTLGRPTVSYTEFNERTKAAELQSKINSSTCSKTMLQFAVTDETDLIYKIKHIYNKPSISFIDQICKNIQSEIDTKIVD